MMTEEYCRWVTETNVYADSSWVTYMDDEDATNPISTPRTCDGILNLYIEAWGFEIRAMTRKCQPEMWPHWGRMNYERCDGVEEVCG